MKTSPTDPKKPAKGSASKPVGAARARPTVAGLERSGQQRIAGKKGLIVKKRITGDAHPVAAEPGVLEYLLATDVPKTRMEVVKKIRGGLSVSVMDRFKAAGLDDFHREMIIPKRTLQHRVSKGQDLSREESERAYRVACILAQADETFGNHKKGLSWLNKPLRQLDNQKPLDVLDTDVGARAVEELLGQIHEGFFA